MKKNTLSILFTLLLVTIFSCSGGSDEGNMPVPSIGGGTIQITPVSSLAFESAGGAEILTIASPGHWEIDEIPEWLTVTPASGNSGDKVTIVCGENATPDDRTATLIVGSGAIATTITVTQYRTIETNYIDMKFDDSDVEYSYNEQNGDLSVTYPAGDMPAVGEQSAIVLPAEYGYDIRVVESVEIDGNVVKMTTTQGNMADLFRNISFTLATSPYSPTRAADGTRIITPVANGYIDDYGVYNETFNTETRATYSDEELIWSFYKNYSGDNIYNGEGGQLYWDKCVFDASLNCEIYYDFGEKEIEGFKIPIGELQNFKCTFIGQTDIDLLLHYKYRTSCSASGDKIIAQNVLPQKVVKFMIGNVPVIVLIFTHLGQQLSFASEGKVDITAGLKFNNSLKFGLEWEKTEWDTIKPHLNYEHNLDAYPITFDGLFSMEGKASYYPQIEVGFYKFAGVTLAPRPYIKEKAEAGMHLTNEGNVKAGWKSETFCGMDFSASMDLDFAFGNWWNFNKNLLKSDTINVIEDIMIYSAPHRIKITSPEENNIKFKYGDTIDVEFLVESLNPITYKYYPCFNAIINLKESGNPDELLTVTNEDGKLIMQWCPEEKYANERINKLTASITDKDGIVISEVTLTAIGDYCEDENHHHMIDLGLPSGIKWACCNIGATKPEEFGGYYAWGETEEKSNYSWSNYKHWSDKRGNGYIFDGECTNIGSDISGTQYDVAHVKWGGSWRMPTLDEIEELRDNCTWKQTTLNDIKGYRVTGPNGNSIFFPAAGYRDGEVLNGTGSHGGCWSATLSDGTDYDACSLYFKYGSLGCGRDFRHLGITVRPVCE